MHMQKAPIGSIPVPGAVKAGRTIQLAPNLEATGFKMCFSRNEEVFGEDEPAEFVYKVISGAVRTTRVLHDGRRQVGAFHSPGDVFGLECRENHRCSAEAVVDSEIALVKRSTLEGLALRDNAAACELWNLTSRELVRVEDHTLLLARKNAVERLATFLLEVSARMPSRTALELPMSRGDIADYLGLTIETVSRTFSTFRRDRAIGLPRPEQVHLLRRDYLEALADGG